MKNRLILLTVMLVVFSLTGCERSGNSGVAVSSTSGSDSVIKSESQTVANTNTDTEGGVVLVKHKVTSADQTGNVLVISNFDTGPSSSNDNAGVSVTNEDGVPVVIFVDETDQP